MSHSDSEAKTRPARTKGTGAINKQRTKQGDRAKAAAKAKVTKVASKPKPAAGQNHPAQTERDDTEPDPSNSTPDNAATFTIDSYLVKRPVICNKYTPYGSQLSSPSQYMLPFVFTHGAGGTLSAPAVVQFCTGFSSIATSPLYAFQGSMNLGARVKGFHVCFEALYKDAKRCRNDTVVFGGRSMGARAAVIAASELLAEHSAGQKQPGEKRITKARLVLVSYPLQGPKDVRDQILLDLPNGVEALFIVGDRDAMCPLDLLEEVRGKMEASSRVVVVRGADHGMDVRPASRTRKLGQEAGKMAARWLGGAIEMEGETMYIGGEEENWDLKEDRCINFP
jgi:predicted alpha/beta-hydrolase family hydrolase